MAKLIRIEIFLKNGLTRSYFYPQPSIFYTFNTNEPHRLDIVHKDVTTNTIMKNQILIDNIIKMKCTYFMGIKHNKFVTIRTIYEIPYTLLSLIRRLRL